MIRDKGNAMSKLQLLHLHVYMYVYMSSYMSMLMHILHMCMQYMYMVSTVHITLLCQLLDHGSGPYLYWRSLCLQSRLMTDGWFCELVKFLDRAFVWNLLYEGRVKRSIDLKAHPEYKKSHTVVWWYNNCFIVMMPPIKWLYIQSQLLQPFNCVSWLPPFTNSHWAGLTINVSYPLYFLDSYISGK